MAPPFLQWGFLLSLLVGAVAVFFHLQTPSEPVSGSETFCYHGVRTEASREDRGVNCFTVSDGQFARVFRRDLDSEPSLRPGYAAPGLWDGHGHLLQYGEFLHSVDLFGAASVEEVRSRIKTYLASHPDAGGKDEWVRGTGWDQMALGGMPTADLLESDERLRGLYIMLDRVDVHCIWVSQSVLDLLPPDVGDIPGGEIVRDPGMGVFCDNAMDLVMPLWPKPNEAKGREFLKSAMKELHKVGLVGMHDAGVFPEHLELFDKMSKTDDWTLRVYAMLECGRDGRNTFCPDKAVKHSHHGGFLTVRSVKLFADGALGSWGSAMIEPYNDRPDMSGSLLVNSSMLTSLARSWAAAGFQVNIHAIGDLANRLAIDAMEAALRDQCSEGTLADCQTRHRFRIEHSQIIHPDDQTRMREIGIIPSIQPTHATSDMKYAEQRLGMTRTANEAYRMKSFVGIGLVLGSDFPVEPPNPFEGIYAAVTRKNPHTGQGPPGAEDGWYREEVLSLEEALAGFTKGPAHGAFLEGKAGVIREKAFADWIVLDQPLEEVNVEDLRNVKVRETWVAGRCVYRREELQSPSELK
ncbi:amidohydrolase [Thozetella sp. PMI_491]|nr:amidohydrolase [Thozetella sp. PMI_491]